MPPTYQLLLGGFLVYLLLAFVKPPGWNIISVAQIAIAAAMLGLVIKVAASRIAGLRRSRRG